MKGVYHTRGTCATSIELEVEDGIIKSVKFNGGCDGNLKGMATLVTDMRAEEAVKRLEGICCGRKATSCPDQLAQALKAVLAER